MICVEIKKAGQLYELQLQGLEDINTAHKTAIDLATGKATYIDGEAILDLGTSPTYEHIRVWKEVHTAPGTAVEPPRDLPALEDKPNYIKPFEDRIIFLGQDITLKGIKALEDGVALVLIYDINGEPAQTKVSPHTLAKLTEHQGKVLGYKAPMGIVPHADLHSTEEAIEYVEDYIMDLRKEKPAQDVTKTATAYFGFAKDERQG